MPFQIVTNEDHTEMLKPFKALCDIDAEASSEDELMKGSHTYVGIYTEGIFAPLNVRDPYYYDCFGNFIGLATQSKMLITAIIHQTRAIWCLSSTFISSERLSRGSPICQNIDGELRPVSLVTYRCDPLDRDSDYENDTGMLLYAISNFSDSNGEFHVNVDSSWLKKESLNKMHYGFKDFTNYALLKERAGQHFDRNTDLVHPFLIKYATFENNGYDGVKLGCVEFDPVTNDFDKGQSVLIRYTSHDRNSRLYIVCEYA